MHIALVYLNKGSGIAHYTLELTRALSRNNRVTCYLSDQNELLDSFGGTGICSKAFSFSRGWKSQLRSILLRTDPGGVAAEIAADRPDFVLDTGSAGWGNLVLYHLKNRVPTCQVVHDPQRHPGLKSFIEDLPNVLLPPPADALISLSDHASWLLRKRISGRIHVASKHGILFFDEQVSPEQRAQLRNKILFLGSIGAYKGIDVLGKAFCLLRTRLPDVELTVAGKGPIAADDLARFEEAGARLINRYLSEEEMLRLLDQHGLMVLPYTSATQSGVAALALARGIPAVASNVGALPEQVVHNRNGIIVKPNDPEALADALEKVCRSQTLASEMSKASYEIGKTEYSWNIISDKLVADLSAAFGIKDNEREQ